jgi:mRNA-degrading endonuclease RelE of RelBE toxin-antitoxin system
MTYSVYTTENFEREMNKLSGEEQERIRKMFLQTKDNPYVGDQLRYKSLREKRLSEKRVYYLVYDELLAVLFVAISGKKDQQETIDYIIKYLDSYKEYLKEKIMND